jgi:hypothetical protein
MQLRRPVPARRATLAVAAVCTLGLSAAPALATGSGATELANTKHSSAPAPAAAGPRAVVLGLKPFDGTLTAGDFNY